MLQKEVPERANQHELALRPSYRNTWICLAFFVAMLTLALSHWGSADPVEYFWSPILTVFAVAGIGGCAYALFARRGCGLFLDPKGFRIRSAWRTRAYRWSDVGAFYVSSDSDGVKSVGFPTNGSPSRTAFEKVARWLSHTTLPGTYRMQAEALAALMNEWRDRAIGRTPR